MSGASRLYMYASSLMSDTIVDEGVYRTVTALVPDDVAKGGAAASYDFMRATAAEMALVMWAMMTAAAADRSQLLEKARQRNAARPPASPAAPTCTRTTTQSK